MNSRNVSTNPARIEALEQRSLMSTSFISIGLSDDPFSGGLRVYSDDGQIDDRGGLTGNRRYGDSLGLGAAVNLPWGSIGFDDKGGLFPDLRDDRFFQPNRTGANFLYGRGFPVGWYTGFGNTSLIRQLQWGVERPTDATIADVDGTWAFNGIEIERKLIFFSDTEGVYGDVTVTNGAATGSIKEGSHGELQSTPFSGTVSSVTSNGVVRVSGDDDFRAFLSKDKSVALWGDFSSHEGELKVGVGVKRGGTFLPNQAAGVYRVGLVLADEINDIHLGNSVVVLDLRLELRPDGSYIAEDLHRFDSGIRSTRFSGSWQLNNNDEITTTGIFGKVNWVLSSNGSTLLPQFITENDGDVRPVAGIGTKVVADAPTASTPPNAFVANENGRAVVYERGPDDIWRKADLQSKAGGPATIGRVESWIDSRDNLLYAAGRSSLGVILYQRKADATWSYRNLTLETPGAQNITSGLTAFRDIRGRAHIAGLNASGQLVVYKDTNTFVVGGRTWEFENLSVRHLDSSGTPLPRLSGELVSYVTPWNGLNITAIDDSGHVHAVWTSPALNGKWILSDLTALTNSGPVSGSLTVFQTSWGAINISGVASTGRVLVTWWTPGMAAWRQDDLTDNSGGPALRTGTVTSYVNPWGGLNIAGLDESGHMHVYWWAPGRNSWSSARMTDDTTPDSLRPSGKLESVVDRRGRVSIFGSTVSGDTVALTFEIAALKWTTTNLTHSAGAY